MFSWARSAAAALTLLTAGSAGAEVVLLHNGGVFEGTVQRTAEAVVVEGDGTYIRLRTAEVVHIADSLLAAYEWKRARMLEGGLIAIDHLDLADWAIENQLWAQAARELLDARQLAPQSHRLELLEHRLDDGFRIANETTTPAADAPAERTEALKGVPAAPLADAPNRSDVPDLPDLPDGALEQFTRRIQPVLLNSCATSGCHGAEPAGGFAFNVASLRGYGDVRSTERNLDATLGLIDVHKPLDSKLLTIAKGPHAGVTPINGPRREEMLKRIAIWVSAIGYYNAPPVAAGTPGMPPAPTTGAAPPMTPGAMSPMTATTPATAPSAMPTASTDAEAPAEPDWEAIVSAAEAKPAEIKHGVQLQRVGPRDEFDPAVFNSRYRRPQDDQPLE